MLCQQKPYHVTFRSIEILSYHDEVHDERLVVARHVRGYTDFLLQLPQKYGGYHMLEISHCTGKSRIIWPARKTIQYTISKLSYPVEEHDDRLVVVRHVRVRVIIVVVHVELGRHWRL